jgi:hypothetical protein
MAYNRTRRIEFIKDSSSVVISKAYSADEVRSLTPAVATGSTDAVVDCALTFARMKWLIVQTDQTILLESADGASANAESHTIAANAPLIWFHDDPVDNPLDDGTLTKITKFLVTNSSGATANLTIEVGYDPTP